MDQKPKKRAPRKAVSKIELKNGYTKPKRTVVLVKTVVANKEPKRKLAVEKVEKSKRRANDQIKSLKNSKFETISFTTGVVSLRLREKAVIYNDWYQQHFPDIARPVAHIFGYMFIVLGFLSVFILATPASSSTAQFLASIICAQVNCVTTQNSLDTIVAKPILQPQVEFLNTIQVEPDKDSELKVSIQNVKEHHLLLISRETGQRANLEPLIKSSDGRFTYLLPTTTLLPGDYKVVVRVLALDGFTRSEFSGPMFIVLPPEIVTVENVMEGNTDQVINDPNIVSGVVSTSETVSPVNTDTNTLTTVDEADPVAEEEKVVVLESNDELPISTREEEKSATTSSASIEPVKVAVIDLVPGVLENHYRLLLKPIYRYSSVEVYARADNSKQALFLGIASRTEFGWVYWLDGKSLPAGRYQLMARAIDNGTVKETFLINFENTYIKPTYTETPTYQESKEVINNQITQIANSTSSQISPLLNPKEPFLPKLLEESTATTSPIASEQERDMAREILSEFRVDFNDLLRRYASAIQTGDENNLRLSEAELAKKLDSVITEKSFSTTKLESIYNLEMELQNKISNLKEQVRKVEDLKVERTKEASRVDSDGDGLSDYDEYILYGTDPKSPDTDNDGVIDGVEISLGYDPLSAKPEAIISFASPKEVNYVDDSLLSVKSVNPLLIYDEDSEKPSVQSEISGFGLPNSFITLYIFSEPIVVTIKTKDDGSFSYTFSKELEDGEHEVYAALTDNQGQIVVRSEPFRFVKQAEAFTYVDAQGEVPLVSTNDTLTPVEKTYNVVAAMGVVALGLILLLLGQTLRQDKIKVVTSSV